MAARGWPNASKRTPQPLPSMTPGETGSGVGLRRHYPHPLGESEHSGRGNSVLRPKGGSLHRVCGYPYVSAMMIGTGAALLVYEFTGKFNILHVGTIVSTLCIALGFWRAAGGPRLRLEISALSQDVVVLYRVVGRRFNRGSDAKKSFHQPSYIWRVNPPHHRGYHRYRLRDHLAQSASSRYRSACRLTC
jgi:hypothetical protein